jgi:hypothetical protein
MQDAPERMNDSGTRTTTDTPLTQANPDLFSLSKSLYRRIPTMPKASRRFAYNLIELIESGAASATPLGDHPIQRPARLIEYQIKRLTSTQLGSEHG